MSTPQANLEILPRSVNVLLLLAVVALAAVPIFGAEYTMGLITSMMIMAIFAMSLDLLQGVTGLVSLGHAAFFGFAGYALAFITPSSEAISLWWSLPLAIAATAGAAAHHQRGRGAHGGRDLGRVDHRDQRP